MYLWFPGMFQAPTGAEPPTGKKWKMLKPYKFLSTPLYKIIDKPTT